MGVIAEAARVAQSLAILNDSKSVGGSVVELARNAKALAATFLKLSSQAVDDDDKKVFAARKTTAIAEAKAAANFSAEEKALIAEIFQGVLT